ncbi:MAG: hypothetical protein AAGE52_06025 [Myxococcota bacterium]
MSSRVLQTWDVERFGGQSTRCELLTFTKRRHDVRKDLWHVLIERLGVTELPYPAKETFVSCSEEQARAYLHRYTMFNLAFPSDCVKDVGWSDAVWSSIVSAIGGEVAWFVNNHMHQCASLEAIRNNSRQDYDPTPITTGASDGVVAGVTNDRLFLFVVINDY